MVQLSTSTSLKLYVAIDNRWCLALVIVCLVFGASLSYAVNLTNSYEDTANTTDIYDRISTLVDSLKVWSVRSVPEKDDDNFTSEDMLNLTQLFPFCEIETVDTMSTIRITLPKYMNLLTTSLLLLPQDSAQVAIRPLWRVPVSGENDYLLIDSVAVPCDSHVVNDTTLLQRISTHLAFLRTISLPPHLQAPYVISDTTEVKVTIRGRDIIDIPFTLDAWLWSLRQLAEGCLVYAGLLTVGSKVDTTNIRHYILITYPEATGHHFLEWQERLVKSGEIWQTETIKVIFSPYIRTDNLKNLFAQPSKPDREPIELKIK